MERNGEVSDAACSGAFVLDELWHNGFEVAVDVSQLQAVRGREVAQWGR